MARRGSTSQEPILGSMKDLKERLSGLGGQGFHFRVKKKNPDKSFGYKGKLDTDVEDIEEALKNEYGDGYYRLYIHFNNGKVCRDIPPLDFPIGNPETWKTTEGKNVTAQSARLKDIDEEIAAKRKQKELLRAERDLQRFEDGAEPNKGSNELEDKLEEMAEMVQALTQQNETLVEEKRQKAFETRIDKMQESMDKKFETLLESRKPTTEVEALKAQLDQLKSDRHTDEIKALREEIAASKKSSGFGIKDVAAITAPFVPVLTAFIANQKNSTTQMIDTITKVGTLMTTAMPKGLDMDKLLGAAPLILKLMPKGPDMSGMFEMVGTMVGPLLEAAASGSGSSDDMSGVIKQVLGTVQKAMEGGQQQQGSFRQLPHAQSSQPGVAPRQAAPPAVAQQRQQTHPNPKPRRAPAPKKSHAVPIIGFTQEVSKAIRQRNEDFTYWTTFAERTLNAPEMAKLSMIGSGAEMATYLCGQPGVDSVYLTTSYAKRWFGAFLKELNRGIDGEPTETLVTKTSESNPEPPPDSTPPIVALPQFSLPKSLLPPKEPIKSPDTDGRRTIVLPNERVYPDDSVLETVPGYQTPAGPIDLTIERPTEAVLAKREAERRVAMEAFQNPPKAQVKFLQANVPGLEPIPDEDAGIVKDPVIVPPQPAARLKTKRKASSSKKRSSSKKKTAASTT